MSKLELAYTTFVFVIPDDLVLISTTCVIRLATGPVEPYWVVRIGNEMHKVVETRGRQFLNKTRAYRIVQGMQYL